MTARAGITRAWKAAQQRRVNFQSPKPRIVIDRTAELTAIQEHIDSGGVTRCPEHVAEVGPDQEPTPQVMLNWRG